MNVNLNEILIINAALLTLSVLLNVIATIKISKANKLLKLVKTTPTISAIVKNGTKDDVVEHQTVNNIVRKWYDEENSYNIIQQCKSNLFKDLDDFLGYVDSNLEVIDVVKEKLRIISKIEKRVYNGTKTVLIIFEDGTRSIFEPSLYAKCELDPNRNVIHTLVRGE
jgi:hypothetical protein